MLSKPQRDCGCGGGKNNCISKNTFARALRAELKRLDCGCGCKGVKGFKKKYGLVGGAILADCPVEPDGTPWRNDGLTCVEPCKKDEFDDGLTCRKKCPSSQIDDGLTCRVPITSSMNECPEGSRDIAGTCWGPVRRDCIDDCFNHPAPGCRTYECGRLKGLFGEDWGPKLCTDCNLRCGQTCWNVDGITKQLHERNLRVMGGEVFGQPIRGKQIRGRVDMDELLKTIGAGIKDLFEGNIDLAKAFDPERNGVAAAFRKFGDDIKKVLEDVTDRIKKGFEQMGAAAKAAFEQMGRDAEQKFKAFGDDFVKKMKDPDFWVEAIGIMAMIAGAAVSILVTVGTLGIGAPAAAGIMAAAAMAGPAAKMIAAGARGQPIDALDIAALVVAGASALVPGMSGIAATALKLGTTAASYTITAVQVGQGLGLIPSTCIQNCPEAPPSGPEPDFPGPPPLSDVAPPGQLSDKAIEDLQPENTLKKFLKDPRRPNPDYMSSANWIARYKAENYGTTTATDPSGALVKLQDKALDQAVAIPSNQEEVTIEDAMKEGEDDELDLGMFADSGADEEVDLGMFGDSGADEEVDLGMFADSGADEEVDLGMFGDSGADEEVDLGMFADSGADEEVDLGMFGDSGADEEVDLGMFGNSEAVDEVDLAMFGESGTEAATEAPTEEVDLGMFADSGAEVPAEDLSIFKEVPVVAPPPAIPSDVNLELFANSNAEPTVDLSIFNEPIATKPVSKPPTKSSIKSSEVDVALFADAKAEPAVDLSLFSKPIAVNLPTESTTQPIPSLVPSRSTSFAPTAFDSSKPFASTEGYPNLLSNFYGSGKKRKLRRGGAELPIIEIVKEGDTYSNPWGTLTTTLSSNIPKTPSGAEFNPDCYAKNNPALAAAFGNDKNRLTTHYIEVGSKQPHMWLPECEGWEEIKRKREEEQRERERILGLKNTCNAFNAFWDDKELKCDYSKLVNGSENVEATNCKRSGSYFHENKCDLGRDLQGERKSQKELCNTFNMFWDEKTNKCEVYKNVDGTTKTRADLCTSNEYFWDDEKQYCDVYRHKDGKPWGDRLKKRDSKIKYFSDCAYQALYQSVTNRADTGLNVTEEDAQKLKDIGCIVPSKSDRPYYMGLSGTDLFGNEFFLNRQIFEDPKFLETLKKEPVEEVESKPVVGSGKSRKSITLYYADWCHFCHDLLPIWKKLRVAGVEIRMIEEKQNNELRVEAYPTIIYRDGRRAEKYKGERTKAGLLKFLKNKL